MTEPRTEALRLLENELGVLIRRVKRVIGVRARAVHEELQPSSYLTLAWLAESGPVRSSSLVEQLNLDKGAVSRQVQHLVDLGLAGRSPDPDDGRATLVFATEDAVRRLADVVQHRRKHLDEQLGDWSDDDLTGLGTALSRYNASLESGTP